MLSRVAETIYWMGRFHERAESTARLIQVNASLMLDLPKGLTPEWEPLTVILGCDADYHQAHDEVTERRVVNFLISDESNPSSILSSLAYARENARTIRDILPREGWETINAMYNHAVESKAQSYARKGRVEYLEGIIAELQRLVGLLAGSMNHDLAYDFLNIGRKLERADMITRIIDVRAENTIPDDVPELRPFEDMLWMSMLKSLSGYQMYRQSMQVRINRHSVLQFLFLHRQFPRSVRYCVDSLMDFIGHLPNAEQCEKQLKKLCRLLKRSDSQSLNNEELHSYIDDLQLQLANLHGLISKAYFPASEQSQSQSQVQAG